MVLLKRTLVEPKQMDTSVVNRAKLVVSMPGWLMRVCTYMHAEKDVMQTNIYIYDAFV